MLAQAVAMLVILASLARFLPALPGAEAATDVLGRGDPWLTLRLDTQSWEAWRQADATDAAARAETLAETEDALRARWLGLVRVPGTEKRYQQLLRLVREIRAEAAPTDAVQLRNVWRNEFWILRYYLHPLEVLGRTREEGDGPEAAVLPESDWVLTSGELREKLRLERVP